MKPVDPNNPDDPVDREDLVDHLDQEIEKVLQAATTMGLSRLDAEVLLADVLTVSRVYLYCWPEKKLSLHDIDRFSTLVKRRLTGEPVAYLIGKKEFWSLSLDVGPGVLIPRPETELLVELTLKLIDTNLLENLSERVVQKVDTVEQNVQSEKTCNILELGTGSGAIALALASERPHWTIFATDISAEALAIAQKNARKLSLSNVHFFLGDWFDALPPSNSTSLGSSTSLSVPLQFHAIISNPPYIEENDSHLSNPELQFEPLLALQAGQKGLQALKKIIDESQAHLLSKAWLLLEHGYDQAEAVAGFFKAKNYLQVENHKDLAAVNRVTVGQKP